MVAAASAFLATLPLDSSYSVQRFFALCAEQKKGKSVTFTMSHYRVSKCGSWVFCLLFDAGVVAIRAIDSHDLCSHALASVAVDYSHSVQTHRTP